MVDRAVAKHETRCLTCRNAGFQHLCAERARLLQAVADRATAFAALTPAQQEALRAIARARREAGVTVASGNVGWRPAPEHVAKMDDATQAAATLFRGTSVPWSRLIDEAARTL